MGEVEVTINPDWTKYQYEIVFEEKVGDIWVAWVDLSNPVDAPDGYEAGVSWRVSGSGGSKGDALSSLKRNTHRLKGEGRL